jgi:2'-5' RNA ligase
MTGIPTSPGGKWRPGTGIYVIGRLNGAVGEAVHELQHQWDPKMARQNPPHVTIVGSSGMGPIAPMVTLEELREALEPITTSTKPMTLRFGPPEQFMQTHIVVLPLDPHGPLRELHERIKRSGLPYQAPRFAFTPHVTLNFYRTLTPDAKRALLAFRAPGALELDRIECSLSKDPQPARRLLELPFMG